MSWTHDINQYKLQYSNNVIYFKISEDLSVYLFIFWRGCCYRACVLTRKTERQRDRKREITPPPPGEDGHTAIPSSPFSSKDLGHIGTGTQHEFKPPGPGLEPWSTTWESSDLPITPSAGSKIFKNLSK